MDKSYQLIHGDCFDTMYYLKDNSVDAIITDPPYGVTDLKFDKKYFDLDKFIQESKRVLKNNGYLVVFSPVEVLGKISLIFPTRWTGIWLKSNPVPRMHGAKKPMTKCEIYSVFAHPKHKIKNLVFNSIKLTGYSSYKKTQHNTGYIRDNKNQIDRGNSNAWTKDGYVSINDGFRWQTNVIEAPNKVGMKHNERTIHPTQKPIQLITTFMKWLTNENDLILDPFVGSGTTILAGLETNRKVIGIELDKNYHNIAQQRINQFYTKPKQNSMF